MSETQAPQFEQVASSLVYETQESGNVGWAGYLLPSGGDPPQNISFEKSLEQYRGHYLFCVERPAILDSDPCKFAEEVLDYIENATNNRVVLWLKSAIPLGFGDFARFGFSFLFFNSVYETTSDLNSRVGANATFYVLQQSRLLIDRKKGALRIFASSSITPPFIGFKDRNGDPLGVKLAAVGTGINAYVPFTGNNTGCVTFSGNLDSKQAFTGEEKLGPGFRFVVNNQTRGEQETIRYRAYSLGSLPATLEVASTFDLSDPSNKVIPTELLERGYLRSGFGIKGKPGLVSEYRTSGGNPVIVTPLGSSTDDLAPPLGAGGFAWASESQASAGPGEGPAYLGLVGRHGLSVAGVPAGSAKKLMGGLFGSETLSFATYDSTLEDDENDLLQILPSQPGYAPVFPFDNARLENPDSGAIDARLTPRYLVSWSTIVAGADPVTYSAEPEGSALYGQAGDDFAEEDSTISVLLSTPPRMGLPQGTDKTFPMVPYGASAETGVDGSTLVQFESQIVAPTRKTTISKNATETWSARARVMSAPDAQTLSYGTTPQGFVVQHEATSSAYLNVGMAQSANLRRQPLVCTPSSTPDFLPFGLVKPTPVMQDALQTNQLFLVAVNPSPFEDKSTGACFENVVNIADWTMSADVGRGASATSYKNVLIMKFCSGTLQERVTNPNRWTAATEFSLLAETPAQTAALSFTGLSQWLQNYIREGIERAEGRSAPFYKNFKEIATDPDWTGVIVLSADLSADDLPPEIAGLAAGIDFTRFAAHHFGFTVSRVTVDKEARTISMAEGDSSLFGLIDYEDPKYASNLDNGVSPDTPIPVVVEGEFDFTVLQLQSLFVNAKLARFESHVQLTVDRLFGIGISTLYNGGQAQPATGIVLDGSYVEQGGRSTYVFEQDTTNVLKSASNVLPAVAFNRLQFNTLGERDGGLSIASRFLVWGTFDFTALNDKDGGILDVLSFGSDPGTPDAQLGSGLAFSNLVITMTFLRATPNAKTFLVDTDNLAWDLNSSTQRKDSLFKGFGLELKSFVSAQGDQKPSDLGFLPVTSELNLTELEGTWFGVVYEITLGGPGALASGVGFQSQFLAAWAPSTTGKDSDHAVFLGMSLPGAAPGASLFSLQGVFKVAVGSISILRQVVPRAPGRGAVNDDEFFYCLRIDDIGIKIFGIVKLPPSANIQFFLFGDPNSTGSLGWYAAYVADENPGCNQSLAFAEVAPDRGRISS